jgi:putative salt-induced outer membrane protein YdiY
MKSTIESIIRASLDTKQQILDNKNLLAEMEEVLPMRNTWPLNSVADSTKTEGLCRQRHYIATLLI